MWGIEYFVWSRGRSVVLRLSLAMLRKAASVLCPPSRPHEDEDKISAEVVVAGGITGRDVFLQDIPIQFKVNGQDVTVDSASILATTSLATYLRTILRLTGTKVSCGQAGCGACVVVARWVNPASGEAETRSINSCVTPVLKCHGWEVTTVEGLGESGGGALHPIQEAVSAHHGTQCGFCTPGMVMAMHGLVESSAPGDPTFEQVEGVLEGNICRCTGYRPIFDAFRSLSTEPDIEDLAKVGEKGKKTCPKSGLVCLNKCSPPAPAISKMAYVATSGGEVWMRPETLDDLMVLLAEAEPGSYRLVAGNTGIGVYPDEGPFSQYIDVTAVPDLQAYTSSSDTFLIGGGLTLNAFIDLLDVQADKYPETFSYCSELASQTRNVANNNVRNVGSLAGNLMLKHTHPDGNSDLFVFLEAVGARVAVRSPTGQTDLYSPEGWLSIKMDGKIVLFVELPPLSEQHRLVCHKVMPRRQNAHAIVSAAVLVKVESGDFVVSERPSLVFGGISSTFVHASQAESYLDGKDISDEAVLRGCLDLLAEEVTPDESLLSSKDFRTFLTQALYYKAVLAILGPDVVAPSVSSGADRISRSEVSSGAQEYSTDESEYPLGEPVRKLESEAQCTGEAEYVDDIAPDPTELYAAPVLATVGNCDFDTVDTAQALSMPGVVAFYDYRDIPGANSVSAKAFKGPLNALRDCYMRKFEGIQLENDGRADDEIDEEIFSSGKIYYAGQAIGIVVADTQDRARAAAQAVWITYKNQKPPLLDLREAMESSEAKGTSLKKVTVGRRNNTSDDDELRTVEGELELGCQYHFHMETQTVRVAPVEDGQFHVNASTQCPNYVQNVIARVLGTTANKVDVVCRRVGGAYGAKANKTNQVAAACAVAASKTKRPVRLVMSLQDNMEMLGKRQPHVFKYKASIDSSDLLASVDVDCYADVGFSGAEPAAVVMYFCVQTSYNSGEWSISGTDLRTNTPCNTACRAPGTAQGHACMEHIMEHLAMSFGLDPVEFRSKNFLKNGDVQVPGSTYQGPNPLPDMVEQMLAKSDYYSRQEEVEAFNAANLWKKRGISLVPMRWDHLLVFSRFTVQVAVYKEDGTVAVSHGGVELGQGINTKVAQVVAKEFGIDLGMVSVKPSDSFVGANNSTTGGSFASDGACSAALIACQDLVARMIEATSSYLTDPDWLTLVQASYDEGVDLTARHESYPSQDGVLPYEIYAVCVTEVEVDVLTGEKNVIRTDLMQDVGDTVSPEVDVGQVEGAFVMGLGMWMAEDTIYDNETGRLFTNDTWDYKPPSSGDIPSDLRTYLYNSGRNPYGVLGSKATGEPCVLAAASVVLAIRRAVAGARKDLGIGDEQWFLMRGPVTNEVLLRATGITAQDFKLYE